MSKKSFFEKKNYIVPAKLQFQYTSKASAHKDLDHPQTLQNNTVDSA
jgi:hypothetical protein